METIEDRFVYLENYVLKELDQVIKDEVEIIVDTILDNQGFNSSGNITE